MNVQMLQDIEENVGQQGQHTQAGHFLPFLQYLHSLLTLLCLGEEIIYLVDFDVKLRKKLLCTLFF